jgi:hypothetical protein
LAHTVALEAIGASATVRDAQTGEEQTVKGFLPAFPTYQIRYGLTDELEIGGRVAALSTPGVDMKYNFLRDKTVDLAIDPGAQIFYLSNGESSAGIGYFYLPLIVDVNLAEAISLVLTPGVMMASAFGSVDDSNEFSATGAMLRVGGGLNIRIADGFSLQPEITIMKPFNQPDSISTLLYAPGLGFNFGTLPGFGGDEASGAKGK